jgi:spore coat polysaccharide biosynthesis protein SpsF (cytidylyltransferase family)
VDTLEDMEKDLDVLVLSSCVNEEDSDVVGLHDDEGVTVIVGLNDVD